MILINHEVSRKGMHLLRFDCVDHNTKLQNFYVKSGFKKQGTSDGHALFQKRYVGRG